MPRYPINRATNFIIEDESWQVIEYDHTSVPGTIYLSLTENKVNMIYDDLVNDIADTDKLAHYELSVPAETQDFILNKPINPSFTLTKNGIPCTLDYILLPTDKTMVKIVNNQLIGQKEGKTQLIVQLKDYPNIFQYIDINLASSVTTFSAYIEGPAQIRLDREAQYTLKGTDEISGNVTYSLSNIDTNDPKIKLASIISIENDTCTIRANDKNKLTTNSNPFILTATYNGVDYTKEIQIIPLW